MRLSPETGWNLVALTAGAVYPLALAPFHHWWLGILAVALLCGLLHNTSPGRSFRRGFFFGLGLFAAGASWIYISIHVYGMAPPWLAATLTGLFVAGLAVLFALPFLLYGCLDRRRSLVVLLVFPAIWLLGEWLRGWFLTGFPWLYLGYGALDTWLSGWAPLVGVLGLTAAAAFSGTVVTYWLSEHRRTGPAIVALVAAALLWGAGWQLQHRSWTEPAGETLKVALVQPDQPLERKWDRNALDEILATLTDLSAGHWDSDLLIWPESAVPQLRRYVPEYLTAADRLATRHDTALLLGIPTREEEQTYNSVLGLGTASGIYHKRHLVPFGEYVPLERWLRGTIHFFDLPMSAFSGGPGEQDLLRAKGYAIATAICYEIVYPDLVAADAGDAQLLLTLSNDTWFGTSIGPHQHFQMARMRALENGKPLLRATNDGITAVIDAHGRVRASLPQFERGTLVAEVRPHRGGTPFSDHGSLPIIAAAGALLLGGLLFARRRRTGNDIVLPSP